MRCVGRGAALRRAAALSVAALTAYLERSRELYTRDTADMGRELGRDGAQAWQCVGHHAVAH
ncbi:MAG: hypothetical protein ACM3SX_04495, partial [Deltaproteobacteria bacterium]